MSSHDLEIEYNPNLAPLEKVLAGVKRPGTFYASGTLEAPMPQLTVEGVGTVSFPVPAAQAEAIIAQAQRAPYGRGSETILDTRCPPHHVTSRRAEWIRSRNWGN